MFMFEQFKNHQNGSAVDDNNVKNKIQTPPQRQVCWINMTLKINITEEILIIIGYISEI